MTGEKTGSGVEMEKLLQRSLLWLACRHHIGEIMLKEACLVTFDVKGSSTSPEVTFLKDFKQLWNNIGNELTLFLTQFLHISSLKC